MPEIDQPVELVAVGRIGRAHGLRGEVAVVPWTDTPAERFMVGTVLTLGSEKGSASSGVTAPLGTLTIEAAREHSGRWLLTFDGVADRTGAEALHGRTLLLPAQARPAIEDPDEFYDSDLTGLTARTADGQGLGRVTDVVHGPGGDYLVVLAPAAADQPAREHLVPFVAEIVPDVDISGGFVVIAAPEGLFEL